MKITAEPRSDQWNADDFVGGPREFTIARVVEGKAEQKYDIELVEGEGRVWRPPPTVLRILIEAWTDEASTWVGRRVRLYRDSSVKFGPEAVGGIRVAALSDLPGGKRLTGKVTVSRGKKGAFTVEPLPAAATKSAHAPDVDLSTITDKAALSAMWRAADQPTRARIEARVAELDAAADPPADLWQDGGAES